MLTVVIISMHSVYDAVVMAVAVALVHPVHQ